MVKQHPTGHVVKLNEVERTLQTATESAETYDENKTQR